MVAEPKNIKAVKKPKKTPAAKTEKEAYARWGFGQQVTGSDGKLDFYSPEPTRRENGRTIAHECPKKNPRKNCDTIQKHYMTPLQPRQRLRTGPRQICEDCRLWMVLLYKAALKQYEAEHIGAAYKILYPDAYRFEMQRRQQAFAKDRELVFAPEIEQSATRTAAEAMEMRHGQKAEADPRLALMQQIVNAGADVTKLDDADQYTAEELTVMLEEIGELGGKP